MGLRDCVMKIQTILTVEHEEGLPLPSEHECHYFHEHTCLQKQ